MTSWFSSLFSSKPTITPEIDKNCITVAVAESVTAGALSNSLCSEPGSSSYFKGGVVAYSVASKKEILGIDVEFAEKNNFANPITTAAMARAASNMFNSRIGIATTGYSLPMTRLENKETGECALNIDKPYAYICLYDRLTNIENITIEEFNYDPEGNRTMQRAFVQAKVALQALKIYNEYVKRIKGEKN
jgi:PncC family amidohydrolase